MKQNSMRQNSPIRSKMELIDGIAMKGKRIIKSFPLKQQILHHLHGKQVGIEKIRLLVHESYSGRI